jgi:hypothetical protein
MKVMSIAMLLVVALTGAIVVVVAEPSSTPSYSKAEVKQMMRDARTAQQYRLLADYFGTQQKKFAEQTRTEKEEWARRSQNVSGLAAKYPRPVDSSKNRYEYFSYEADQMGEQSSHYARLAAAAQ